ncbi:MAG: hypothetical protein QNJ49_19825 [Mastigocoleus sp. MO_167.B18]|nr:hypothetical protein [Mastigocoleus sp. MO_167.B18]
MKTQDTNPFHQKLSIAYIIMLFLTLLVSIWWTRRTTPKPEIIDPNIANTEQTNNVQILPPIMGELAYR